MSTLKVNRIEPRTGDTVEIIGFEPGGGGKILQVVSGYFPLEAAIGPTGVLVKTAVEVSITPSSVNSRVMLHLNGGACSVAQDRKLVTGFFRDDTVIEGSGTYMTHSEGTNWGHHSMSWVDSPNTTSEITYTLGVDAITGSCYYAGFHSTARAIQLIAMEIGE